MNTCKTFRVKNRRRFSAFVTIVSSIFTVFGICLILLFFGWYQRLSAEAVCAIFSGLLVCLCIALYAVRGIAVALTKNRRRPAIILEYDRQDDE